MWTDKLFNFLIIVHIQLKTFIIPVVDVFLSESMLYLDGKRRPVVEGEAEFWVNHVSLYEAEDFN